MCGDGYQCCLRTLGRYLPPGARDQASGAKGQGSGAGEVGALRWRVGTAFSFQLSAKRGHEWRGEWLTTARRALLRTDF
jgi:hypothetical protein